MRMGLLELVEFKHYARLRKLYMYAKREHSAASKGIV